MNVIARTILLSGLSTVALASNPAFAQNQAPPETAGETSQAQVADNDVIVVTGTRTSGRTVADSPVPVDVISSDAIVNSGQTETNKILNQLVPSFNFPQPSIADGSDALRPATLRGLSPDQTLVLVNGKRRHVAALLNINGTVGRGSAAVDLNLIPSIGIARVEVLRDGAAAQYGSDAIAGVINVQMKNAKHGGRASVTFGQYRPRIDNVLNSTGLRLHSAGLSLIDPNSNPTGPYFMGISDGERTVNDGEQLTAAANIGVPIGDRGYVNLTGEYHYRQPTNRAGFDLRPNFTFSPFTAIDPREVGFNRLEFRFGDP